MSNALSKRALLYSTADTCRLHSNSFASDAVSSVSDGAANMPGPGSSNPLEAQVENLQGACETRGLLQVP